MKPGEVRIIGGQWRRTPIKVLDSEGLRPTPDRVRETLFNWLGQDLSGYCCVDLFAGTGVLGFESASRGAQKVWLFEAHAALVHVHEQLKSKLQAQAIHIKKGDSLALLRGLEVGAVDVFFIDPPFNQDDLFDGALSQVPKYLSPQGRVYLESPKAWDDQMLKPYGLRVLKHLKAGAVHAHLLERAEFSST